MGKFVNFWKRVLKKEYIKYYAIGAAILFFLIFCLLIYLKIRNQQNTIEQLSGELQGYRAEVIKLQDGLYLSESTVVDKISRKNRDIINEEVDKIIKKNKLDIVYASQVKMGIKLQEVIKDQSKPVVVVSNDENKPTDVPQDVVDTCNTCLGKTKIRIPFEGQRGNIFVSGYAETGEKIGLPGKYELDIRVLKEMTLNIVLAQGKDKKWKTIISDPEGALEVYNIKSSIDIRPFKPTFKERIMFPIGVGVGGQTALIRVGIYFKLIDKLDIGLDAGGILNYKSLLNSDGYLGIGFIVHPF